MVAATTPAAAALACDVLRDQVGELAEVRTPAARQRGLRPVADSSALALRQRVGRSLIYDGRQTLSEVVRTTVRRARLLPAVLR